MAVNKTKLARARTTTDTTTLTALAQHKSAYVRRTVARNPNTLPSVLTELAADKSSQVRSSVAGNRNTPVDTLVALANTTAGFHWELWRKLAGNPTTPVAVLDRLLACPNHYATVSLLASNKSTTPAMLVRLITGNYPKLYTSEYLSSTIARRAREELFKRPRAEIRQAAFALLA